MFEVTRKIEDATANIPGARHVTSTISDGFSETFIEFEINKDVQEALDDVRDAVTGVRSALPADVLEPTISRVTTNGSSIATYAISADNMDTRSEEHTSELQSLMRISYAVFCLKKKKKTANNTRNNQYEKTLKMQI